MLYAFTLVLLFLIRLRFPRDKSIAQVISLRYGADVVQSLRKWEKLNFKRRKVQLDIEFLRKCESQCLIPAFLKFKLPNQNLRSSSSYKSCQLKLLHQEIRDKVKLEGSHQRRENQQKELLQSRIRNIDFIHLSFLCSDTMTNF